MKLLKMLMKHSLRGSMIVCAVLLTSLMANAHGRPQGYPGWGLGYGPSCTQVACNFANTCGATSDYEEMVRACRGVDGECVRAICTDRSCGFKSQVLEVVQACRGADAACVRMGCFHGHCHFDSDAHEVLNACRGYVDEECLRGLCNRGGDCSFLSKFREYAVFCRQ